MLGLPRIREHGEFVLLPARPAECSANGLVQVLERVPSPDLYNAPREWLDVSQGNAQGIQVLLFQNSLVPTDLEQEFQAFAHSFREETLLPIITGRKTLKIAAAPGGRAPQTGLSREKRELVDKLLKEKIPFASIARITDLEETRIRDYAARKSS